MKDFAIAKCNKSDSEGVRSVAKANNYFDPEYVINDETGFT